MTTGTRPLKVGFILYNRERSLAGATPRWTDMLALARQVEQAGFDSLWLIDHFSYRFPGDTETRGLWECWSVLSALAAGTERLELGTLVLGAGFRNPALTAKMADTVDEISGGRLILGLGAGYHELEYQQFGYPFDHRVSRFEEALRIIHGLLQDGEIDFEGTFYAARECELRPRGPRPPGPPILVGTRSPRMLRLTAQYADIWTTSITNSGNHPDRVPPLRVAVDAACEAVGRDPATLRRTLGVRVAFPEGANARVQAREAIRGSAEEVAETFWAFADDGIAHLMLRLAPETAGSIEQIGQVIELMDRGR
jgi:alkanesulfonate monooxygenase SsuD/methylene tetrahydromethanopterin reductase-like flavin-dependent oxidoreductase (luciferase family)